MERSMPPPARCSARDLDTQRLKDGERPFRAHPTLAKTHSARSLWPAHTFFRKAPEVGELSDGSKRGGRGQEHACRRLGVSDGNLEMTECIRASSAQKVRNTFERYSPRRALRSTSATVSLGNQRMETCWCFRIRLLDSERQNRHAASECRFLVLPNASALLSMSRNRRREGGMSFLHRATKMSLDRL